MSEPFGESRAAFTFDPMLEGVLEDCFQSCVGLHLPDGRYASNGGLHRPVEYHPVDESGVLKGIGDRGDDFNHVGDQQTVERVGRSGLEVDAGMVELEGGLYQSDGQLQ
eukprot:2690872-Pleurochrysis_carterae.AAC.1